MKGRLCLQSTVIRQSSVKIPSVKAAAASMETARKEEIKAQVDVLIDEKGNVSSTSSESEKNDEEKEGKLIIRRGGYYGYWAWLFKILWLFLLPLYLIIVIKFRVSIVDIKLYEESYEEKEGQADNKKGWLLWLLGMVVQTPLVIFVASNLYLIIVIKFRVAIVDIMLSEKSDEENEGQADNKKGWLLGMVVQAFCLLVKVALRLIKAAKFGIKLGVFQI